MKILFLMKRFSSGKDMVLEDFGRQMRLGDALLDLGHEVAYFCADYKRHETFQTVVNRKKVYVQALSPVSFLMFQSRLNRVAAGYDVIIGATDPFFGVIGSWVARRKGKYFVYDIQDNYEAYGISKIFFMKSMEQKAIRNADLVTVWSPSMEQKVKAVNPKTLMIPNGVDLKLVKIASRTSARKLFSLPQDRKIIVYTGRYNGEAQTKGIDMLIRAFARLRKRRGDVVLFMAGDGLRQRLAHERGNEGIIAVDSMPFARLMKAISVADVLVIPYAKTKFTEYMLTPYKLPEYMAFNKPIVCSNVGQMKDLLQQTPDLMFNPDDESGLIGKLELALSYGKVNYKKELMKLTWKNLGEKIHNKLLEFRNHKSKDFGINHSTR